MQVSIIVSELTPRQYDPQNVIKKVNVEINQRIKEVPDCLLINHDNVNSRDLYHDKKHLKKSNGIPLLARNINAAIGSSRGHTPNNRSERNYINRRSRKPRGYFHIRRSGGGGLDLTSSLEAKFGDRSSQIHQIRGKTWEDLSL